MCVPPNRRRSAATRWVCAPCEWNCQTPPRRDYFAAEYANVSAHTNYQMAALSLSACVRSIEDVLAGVVKSGAESAEP